MDNENTQRKFESVYSTKVRAGKRRTYFFDVRKTKGDDYYITLTESTRRYNGDGYERHKIFLYKEDFNRFIDSLGEAIDHVKTELMPDYDYDEFTRRQEEWEKQKNDENKSSNGQHTEAEEKTTEHSVKEPSVDTAASPPPAGDDNNSVDIAAEADEEDMTW